MGDAYEAMAAMAGSDLKDYYRASQLLTEEEADRILKLCGKRQDSKGGPKPTPGVWYQALGEIESIVQGAMARRSAGV